jgi:Uma2 family endonuclease
MNIIARENRYTPEDLLTMPDGDRFELVDGQLVERSVSLWSSYVAGRVNFLITAYARPNHLGWPLPEGATYQCFPTEPNKVRKADFSFILLKRMTPAAAMEKGHIRIAPDLAVEAVSPNDLYYEVDTKVQEWLGAGVRLLWIINPDARTVRIYRADGSDASKRAEDEISGEDVVPGFCCRVREFFELPSE